MFFLVLFFSAAMKTLFFLQAWLIFEESSCACVSRRPVHYFLTVLIYCLCLVHHSVVYRFHQVPKMLC